MEAADLIWHVLSFFAPALGLGLISASGAKLLWRRELAAVAWRTLARDSCLAAVAMLLAGLLLWSGDGRMATYAAMVVACALTLWWRAWGHWRR